ncbi:MAG: FKBP-type peptidyl-prolyl cis-trans isomerase [Magnetococcales bacterium]|nr:FKBP-type peptidyl-prolyl cis-trans isomerase [Magnetococcales bacterium]
MNGRNLLAGVALFCFAAILPLNATAAGFKGKLVTEDQKFSYYMGLQFGLALKGSVFEVDQDVVERAIKDVMDERKLLVSKKEIVEIRSSLTKKLRAKQASNLAEIRKKNSQEGKDFLNKNRKEKGVRVTSSGLQYKALKDGSGPRPSAMDSVTVHYRGTLLNGKVFDSSYKREKPATFTLSQVIPGWTEGVQLMNVGSKYKFFIPSNLAYGARGEPRAGIGPDSTLIFEVELLEIK